MSWWTAGTRPCGPCAEDDHEHCLEALWVRDYVDHGAAVLIAEPCTCWEVDHYTEELLP